MLSLKRHPGRLFASALFAPVMALSFVHPTAVAQSTKPARPTEKPSASVKDEKRFPTNEELQADPELALKVLMEGNRRFASGETIHPRQDINRIRETAKGQKPFAIIVGCSDSRVPNEIIFDQGLGDLFIVRTAGQVSTYASWGSIEFAEEVLGAKLIFVLGHTKCGAVQAAVQVPEVPGHIVTLINDIKPAAQRAKGQPGDEVQNAIRENVRMQVEKLKTLEPVLAKRVREGKLKIVGGVYDIETGVVSLVE
ncbi:MAG: carbonic anhydrase [Chloracidobacterium sp.]|nr:carbonic anhydrase [Chloracidobacterium sp.]MDW8216275.1 carbonic anhydrase [Acidobacteriota bacterium]